MAVEQKLTSAADLWEMSHLPEYANKRIELVDGRVIEMPLNGGRHGLIALEVGVRLGNFIAEHDLGYSIAGGTGYQLSEWTVRVPDFGYIQRDRLPGGLSEDFVPVAPDLAVEVISHDDKAEIIHGRVLDLLHAGTHLMWVIYLTNRTAVIHTPSGSHMLDPDGILDSGDVLPGFSVPLKEVFSVLK